MVRLPARPSELGLAFTDQDALLPEIETEAQLAALMRRGCTMVQGYLLAKPQPADRVLFPVDALDAIG